MNWVVFWIVTGVVVGAIVLVGLIILFVRLIMRMLSKMSGQAALAERYPATYPPEGPPLTMQNIQIGSIAYRRCASLSCGPGGIYVFIQTLVGNRPAIRIPWSEIALVEPARLYWHRALRLHIGRPTVATITVMGDFVTVITPWLAQVRA